MNQEEDFYKDDGVAYNSENFDDDNIFTMSMDSTCDGCWEDCIWGENEVHKHCLCWKSCREEYETL